MAAVSNRRAVFAKRSPAFLAIRRRRRRARACMFAERIETPLGTMLAVADDEGLRLLEFADRRALERELTILRQRLKTNVVPGEHRHLDAIRAQLGRLFCGQESGVRYSAGAGRIGFSTPRLGKSCVRFRLAKRAPIPGWRSGLVIPGARRAVGRANGTNMLCIIIPCHRVIRADGTLCGYGGGLWRKKWLLDHERK